MGNKVIKNKLARDGGRPSTWHGAHHACAVLEGRYTLFFLLFFFFLPPRCRIPGTVNFPLFEHRLGERPTIVGVQNITFRDPAKHPLQNEGPRVLSRGHGSTGFRSVPLSLSIPAHRMVCTVS